MTMCKTLTPLLMALLATTAAAKLPAPSDEAKAKAAEAAARTAHAGKVDNYKLCLSMDKAAAGYHAAAKQARKAAPAPTETPACADPGPFVAAAASAAPTPVVAAAPAAPAAAAKK